MEPPLPPVLFVTGEYPPDVGGLADYTARLRRALDERGQVTMVLTHRGRGAQEAGVYRQIGAWDLRGLVRIATLAPFEGIVHLQYQAAAFGLRGEIALTPMILRARRPDVRVATTFHDARLPYLFPKAGPLRPAALQLLARTSAAVIAADAADLDWLGGPSPRHHLVPIGSNVPARPPAGYERSAFRTSLGLAENDLAIAYFGFLNASKGLETLLGAVHLVVEREPRTRLLVLGGAVGASDRTDRETARLFQAQLGPLTDRVLHPGHLTAEQLSAHLLAADVAVLPYLDGASMRRGSLLACAEHGLPIVTTSGPGVSGPLRECVLAEPMDAQAIAETILRVAQEPALRKRLQAGSRRLAGLVRWDEITGRHRDIYATLQSR